MGRTVSERKAVTRQIAVRYRSARKGEKARILDELCATTGWNRDHARKALRSALGPKPVGKQRKPRPPVYGPEVIAALRVCWAVMDAPAGKRMAPFLPELVNRLRACGELDLGDETARQLCAMSPATIDRRLASDRKKLQVKGRSGTKPGSLLKSQIPIRTWADWDDARPGFVEIDLVGHEGGNPRGDFCQTLTVTDIATGWTETRAVKNKAQKWIFAALKEIIAAMPFPVLGIDSDNGSEFINDQLLRYCTKYEITFTRSRVGNKNDGAHVEQKNWSHVRYAVGYARYNTPAELAVLNQLYEQLRLERNFFAPQQKLISKTRNGSTVSKRYDQARTPFQRLQAEPDIEQTIIDELAELYATLNPAQLRRDLTNRQDQLLRLSAAKGHPDQARPAAPTRASESEATKTPSRAS